MITTRGYLFIADTIRKFDNCIVENEDELKNQLKTLGVEHYLFASKDITETKTTQ